MNTHFRRFKMLSLQIMTGDALKDDVNNPTSCFLRILMTFCVFVGLHDVNQHCVEHRTVEIAIIYVTPVFVRPRYI